MGDLTCTYPAYDGAWHVTAAPDGTLTGAITGGMNPKNTDHFDTHEDMAHMLKMRVSEGDVLLFKGSRGMRMEKVLQLFLDDKK